MRRKKALLLLVVLAFASLGLYWGFISWRAGVMSGQEQRGFQQAQRLIAQGELEAALSIIRLHSGTASRLDWVALEVRALAGQRAAPQLANIFQKAPERILADEEASLVLARAYLSSRNAPLLARIRDRWRGHESRRDNWLVLDSDAQWLAGKPGEAEKILRSQTFSGRAEADRLVRLSLFAARRDLPETWQLLAQATQLAPRNPEIRSFRAQILEATGKPGAAQVEYTAALAADQKNPLLRDQLADFYRRQGNYDFALKLWQDCLAEPTFDFVWLKTAFWQRMLQPGKLDVGSAPPGELQPLVRWLAALPAGKFFNSNTFNSLPLARSLEQQRQEIFWLQLADALQNQSVTQAVHLLGFRHFNLVSWQPDLQVALVRILRYRQNRSFSAEGFPPVNETPTTNRHQFFTALSMLNGREHNTSRAVVPEELDALLRGPDAFAAAFLAAGWREAAISLCTPDHCPTNEPVWLTYGLANALRANRGAAAGRDFLARQRPEPELQLLAAEMLIADGLAQEGLNRLPGLAGLDNATGYRASCLLVLANLDLKKYDLARDWVRRNPRLAGDRTGRELMAQIALSAGQTNEAETIYRGILSHSTAAKTYFARQAYSRRDWANARRLTTELLVETPDNLQLRADLLAIDRAEVSK
jgi:tetratricopeptide (TPR) repeat protein